MIWFWVFEVHAHMMCNAVAVARVLHVRTHHGEDLLVEGRQFWLKHLHFKIWSQCARNM